jgi:hypothetical protein
MKANVKPRARKRKFRGPVFSNRVDIIALIERMNEAGATEDEDDEDKLTLPRWAGRTLIRYLREKQRQGRQPLTKAEWRRKQERGEKIYAQLRRKYPALAKLEGRKRATELLVQEGAAKTGKSPETVRREAHLAGNKRPGR